MFDILSACMSVYSLVLLEARRADGFQLLWVSGIKPGPPERAAVLLAAKSSFQPLSPCFMVRDNKSQRGVGPSASQVGEVLLVPGPQCPFFMPACIPQHQPCASPGPLAAAAPAGLQEMFAPPGSGARAESQACHPQPRTLQCLS